MKKYIFGLSILIIIILGCKKNNENNSASSILINHVWYSYQIHEVHYTGVNNNYTLTKDTTYSLSNFCSPESKYQFELPNIFLISSTCINPQNIKGTWSLSTDNFLSGSIPTNILGTIYYVGIEGHILEIDNNHFNTSKTQVLNYFNNGVIGRDSTISIITYRN